MARRQRPCPATRGNAVTAAVGVLLSQFVSLTPPNLLAMRATSRSMHAAVRLAVEVIDCTRRPQQSTTRRTVVDTLGALFPRVRVAYVNAGNISSLQRLEHLVVLCVNCRGETFIDTSLSRLRGVQSLTMIMIVPSYRTNRFTRAALTNLEYLPSLKMLPLVRLKLDMSSLTWLPALPPTLTELDVSGCTNLQSLPASLGELAALEKLKASGCMSFVSLPESIGRLMTLTTLQLDWCVRLMTLPASLGHLDALTCLDVRWCLWLENLPELANGVRPLVVGSGVDFTTLVPMLLAGDPNPG